MLCTSIQNASRSQSLNSCNEKSHVHKFISSRPSLWSSVIITSKKLVYYPVTAFNSEIKKIVFNFVPMKKFQDSSFSDVKEYFHVTFRHFLFESSILSKIQVFWDVMLHHWINSFRHSEGLQCL